MLYSTGAATWLCLQYRLKMDLHSVWIMPYAKQVQYVEPQEDHIFLTSVSLTNLDIGIFGYI